MKVLVACTEIGSAVSLNKVLEEKNISKFYLIGSEIVIDYFSTLNFDSIVINKNQIPENIDSVLLGSTLGHSIERIFYHIKYDGVHKIAVIDSYWNIYQRFADEITGTRWQYVPDEIYVPNKKISRILKKYGYDGIIRIFDSPSFKADKDNFSSLEKKYVRNKYGVSEDKKVHIFISEYYQKVPDRWNIEVDQYNYDDIQFSINSFSKHIDYLNKNKNIHIPFIKWHPTMEDKFNLKLPSNLKKNQLISISKEDLFKLGDIFVGINSMLLLEAYNRGHKTMSYMSKKMMKKNNLSNFINNMLIIDNVNVDI